MSHLKEKIEKYQYRLQFLQVCDILSVFCFFLMNLYLKVCFCHQFSEPQGKMWHCFWHFQPKAEFGLEMSQTSCRQCKTFYFYKVFFKTATVQLIWEHNYHQMFLFCLKPKKDCRKKSFAWRNNNSFADICSCFPPFFFCYSNLLLLWKVFQTLTLPELNLFARGMTIPVLRKPLTLKLNTIPLQLKLVLPQLTQRSGKTWVSSLYFCTDPCACLFGCRSGSSPWPRPATCRTIRTGGFTLNVNSTQKIYYGCFKGLLYGTTDTQLYNINISWCVIITKNTDMIEKKSQCIIHTVNLTSCWF